MPTPLSGYYLEKNGWKKKGFTWIKNLDTITYDGCDFMYYRFPECVNDENYSTGGLKIIPRKINYIEDIKTKKMSKAIVAHKKEIFGEDYYMNGIESGVSNYVDYRWLPELTLAMAKSFIEIFGVQKGATILDFGCARGFFVKALMEHGVNAFGVDVSEWAIKNCHEDVVGRVFNKIEDCPLFYDYIFSKDVLEHIPTEELLKIIPRLLSACRGAAIFIVPLAKSEGGEYIYPNDELDKTHIHRKTLQGWVDLIEPFAKDFTIFVSNKIPSLKKASEQFKGSTGIIYCKKIKK